ncbi:basic proline-rich protein-like isoform X2 [Eubalaena glacialis]|uniref:basic proline-rich protein-like isoform X2 n=1 Tax=Eubalaena glacialis TaxID=27606 RepID=UPI002A5ACFE9|nr:basic proline-rich protein-like isoform X2 [Eubalaena glacialis]
MLPPPPPPPLQGPGLLQSARPPSAGSLPPSLPGAQKLSSDASGEPSPAKEPEPAVQRGGAYPQAHPWGLRTQRAEIHAASVTHPSLATGASRRAPRGRGAGRAAPGARALPAEGNPLGPGGAARDVGEEMPSEITPSQSAPTARPGPPASRDPGPPSAATLFFPVEKNPDGSEIKIGLA